MSFLSETVGSFDAWTIFYAHTDTLFNGMVNQKAECLRDSLAKPTKVCNTTQQRNFDSNSDRQIKWRISIDANLFLRSTSWNE